MFVIYSRSSRLAILFMVATIHLLLLLTIGCQPSGHSYKEFSPPADPELRDQPITEDAAVKELDLSAMEGFPEEYRQAVSGYLQAVCDELSVTPITRQRYYHVDRSEDLGRGPLDRFPDDINPVFDREVSVPLTILPRPQTIEAWTSTQQAQASGWLPQRVALNRRGSVYGRTIIFEPGARSNEITGTPASPIGWNIPSIMHYGPELDANADFFRVLGKVICEPYFGGVNVPPGDVTKPLRLGEEEGAVTLAETHTVPANLTNSRLLWTRIQQDGTTRSFLAYALVDGNGGRRARWYSDLPPGSPSHYIRPLECKMHQPMIKQHDLLLLPRPIGWPSVYRDDSPSLRPHEEWCLDDWFPAQDDACWVIRETEESKPLMESFAMMPAGQQSDLPVFFIAVFAETKPAQLVRELSALYRVSEDVVLKSTEKMTRLNALYNQVSQFHFDE